MSPLHQSDPRSGTWTNTTRAMCEVPMSDVGSALAAVDSDGGAADPAGSMGGEEGDDVADFVGAAHPTEWQVPLDEVGDPLRIRLLALVPRSAREQDRPRSDAVDADVR